MDIPFLLYPDRQMLPEGEKGKKYNHASDILMVEPTLVPNADGIDDRTYPASTRSEEHTDRLQRPNASIGELQQIETCWLDESPATTYNNRSFKGNFTVIASRVE